MTTRHIYIACKNCKHVFEIHGNSPNPCPDCGSLYTPTRTEVSNLSLQEKLYGTTNNPKWNLGLGTWTTGKKDREIKADQRKMVPY